MPELIECLAMVENTLTFAGLLYERGNEIFNDCNAETRSSYNGKYNLHILPRIGEIKITELTLEDCEDLVRKIEESNRYKPSTIQQYRYLIREPIKYAAKLGLCDYIFYGTIFSLDPKESEGKAKKNELTTLKKSFSILEELRLHNLVLTDYKEEGEKVGIGCMYASGGRNSEVCGADFGALKEMEHYPEEYCLWLYETTEGDTNNLKPGGKTSNAPRILPVPLKFAKFLLRRKAYIEEEIAKGSIKLCPEDGVRSVDDLPIVCKGHDFTRRCSSRDLTNMGRKILQEIKVSEEAVAYIAAALEEEENRVEMGLCEKNPTAYITRRHLGTTLYLLGFTETEIEYYMGHELVDSDAIRNEYTNEERLHEMALKLNNRPLFREENLQGVDLQLTSEESFKELNDVYQVTIDADEKLLKDGEIVVVITAEEVNDPIEITLNDYNAVRIDPFRPQKKEVSKVVNTIEKYQQAYQRICEKENVNQQEKEASGEK